MAVGDVRYLYDRDALVRVLVHHQRRTAQYCICGWGVLGASHAEHIADEYEKAVKAKAKAEP